MHADERRSVGVVALIAMIRMLWPVCGCCRSCRCMRADFPNRGATPLLIGPDRWRLRSDPGRLPDPARRPVGPHWARPRHRRWTGHLRGRQRRCRHVRFDPRRRRRSASAGSRRISANAEALISMRHARMSAPGRWRYSALVLACPSCSHLPGHCSIAGEIRGAGAFLGRRRAGTGCRTVAEVAARDSAPESCGARLELVHGVSRRSAADRPSTSSAACHHDAIRGAALAAARPIRNAAHRALEDVRSVR